MTQLNLSGLTTPEIIDKNVRVFCAALSSSKPCFVKVKPELWSRQSCCELNVEKLVEQRGGRKLIGYKIWYLKDKYIEAERHVILEDDGDLIDPTFNTDGENRILFVSDSDSCTSYQDREIKISRGFSLAGNRLAKQVRRMTAGTINLSNEESWNQMITYEDWLAGKRHQNTWVKNDR